MSNTTVLPAGLSVLQPYIFYFREGYMTTQRAESTGRYQKWFTFVVQPTTTSIALMFMQRKTELF